MVAFGNPPYFGESANKGKWILEILKVYKQEPTGGKLQEKNSKWLNDDYVKFIRLGEYYIEKNGEGVLAYITNHGYLDNPTFRGMRWHLLNTFHDIYILDLHGNANKKEMTPNGKPDKNVFDILPGVAIIVAVKKGRKSKKAPLATLHHIDLWGERQKKYDFLEKNNLKTTTFTQLDYQEPFYFFVPKNFKYKDEYNQGFGVRELFLNNNTGIITKRDNLCIQFTPEHSMQTLKDFMDLPEEEVKTKYKIRKDVRDWKYKWAKKDIEKTGLDRRRIIPIQYRPFDTRYTFYTGNSKGYVGWPVSRITDQFYLKDNIALVTSRMTKGENFAHTFVSKNMTEVIFLSSKTSNNAFIFPLYSYENIMGQGETKNPNLNSKIYSKIQGKIHDLNPENLFNYIYAVLSSGMYRKKYAEFLKIDFPRIPYPTDIKTFHTLAKLGLKLRELHLMESNRLNDLITTYPVDGDHEVNKKPDFKDGKVWINETQYFGNVPEVAWEFYIGGYHPAQKWLKDRKGQKLSIDDIRHWQRIIVSLTETDKIMKQIDSIDFLPTPKQ